MRSRARLAWPAAVAAVIVTGCGSVRNAPANPKAVDPVTLVTQGSGPGGDYRVWAFRTFDGWACIEVDSENAEGGSCDPAGGAPAGGGMARNAHGIVVDGMTTEASAITAVMRDASGATLSLPLVEVGSALPGAKVVVVSLGPAANPLVIDFLDAAGSTVDSAPFDEAPSGGGAVTSP